MSRTDDLLQSIIYRLNELNSTMNSRAQSELIEALNLNTMGIFLQEGLITKEEIISSNEFKKFKVKKLGRKYLVLFLYKN